MKGFLFISSVLSMCLALSACTQTTQSTQAHAPISPTQTDHIHHNAAATAAMNVGPARMLPGQ